MAVCPGIKRDGGRCTVVVTKAQEYCYQHDPARGDERRKAASRAGRAKANREIPQIKKQIDDLADDVRAGRVERGTGAVLNQILNTKIRAIELARRVREQDDLLPRIAALELRDRHTRNRGGRRWG